MRPPTTQQSAAQQSAAPHGAARQPTRSAKWPRRLSWLVSFAAAGSGVLFILAWAIMVRVCSDAKPVASQNYRALPFFVGLPPVLDIAHRGASKLAPEHSMEAYRLALEQGAHVLELDLRLLRSQELVVAHDRSLRRTHGLDASYADLTWPDLERLAGARVPIRLAQALREFPSTRFNLELKDEAPNAARVLAKALEQAGAERRVLVASGHAAVLGEFRRASAGRVATSASLLEALNYYFCDLMRRDCSTPYCALQLPPSGWLGTTGAPFIARAHERGLAVHFWTVDDPREMQALLAAGADGIMTNRPDVLARLLGAAPGR